MAQPTCRACAAEAVRAPGPAPGACRRCGKASLARLEIGGWGCPACHGVFFDGADWDKAIETIRFGEALELGSIVPPAPGASVALVAEVKCASCGAAMERTIFGARSKITVDVCPKHGIWLDAGEVAGVFEFVRKLWQNNGIIPVPPEAFREEGLARERVRADMEDRRRIWDEEQKKYGGD
jgi:Zn-finger nucleic acid-binding protein